MQKLTSSQYIQILKGMRNYVYRGAIVSKNPNLMQKWYIPSLMNGWKQADCESIIGDASNYMIFVSPIELSGGYYTHSTNCILQKISLDTFMTMCDEYYALYDELCQNNRSSDSVTCDIISINPESGDEKYLTKPICSSYQIHLSEERGNRYSVANIVEENFENARKLRFIVTMIISSVLNKLIDKMSGTIAKIVDTKETIRCKVSIELLLENGNGDDENEPKYTFQNVTDRLCKIESCSDLFSHSRTNSQMTKIRRITPEMMDRNSIILQYLETLDMHYAISGSTYRNLSNMQEISISVKRCMDIGDFASDGETLVTFKLDSIPQILSDYCTLSVMDFLNSFNNFCKRTLGDKSENPDSSMNHLRISITANSYLRAVNFEFTTSELAEIGEIKAIQSKLPRGIVGRKYIRRGDNPFKLILPFAILINKLIKLTV